MQTNLQKEFESENYGRRYIELPNRGFICYEVFDDSSVYVYQIFVAKRHRRQGLGTVLEQMLIEAESPSEIWCDIDKSAFNWKDSLKAILSSDYSIRQDNERNVLLCRKLKKKT